MSEVTCPDCNGTARIITGSCDKCDDWKPWPCLRCFNSGKNVGCERCNYTGKIIPDTVVDIYEPDTADKK